MKIFLRKLTNNDTKKQIETTAEIYEDFFNGSTESEEIYVDFTIGSSKLRSKLSKGGGNSNSYRFTRLSQFLKENGINFEADDILKVTQRNNEYEIEVIQTDNPAYLIYRDLFIPKQNTIIYANQESSVDWYKSNYTNTNNYSYNRIFFGAPGTGKSYELEQQRKQLLVDVGEYERVTFHPDYSYSQFVGTYKPVPIDEEKITYEYIPGPFMRILVKALLNIKSGNPYLLIIEEINRANVAAVFGEIFQLLDRSDGISDYAINLSEDMKKYIIKEFNNKGVILDAQLLTEIKLPNNLFIWASMNSADQGVFPMDTAFKRRWEFEYFGIDDNEEKVASYKTDYELSWNQLRKAINELLSTDQFKINEDKLMGPFFINPKNIAPKDSDIMKSTTFNNVFKNKVIMYLFDDAVKQRRAQLFAPGLTRYSQICATFDNNFDADGNLVTNIESLFDIFKEKNQLIKLYYSTNDGNE